MAKATEVLKNLIKSAAQKEGQNNGINIEELLGELYIKAKTGKAAEKIFDFAGKNNLWIVIP